MFLRLRLWIKEWILKVVYGVGIKGKLPIVMVDGVKGRLRQVEFTTDAQIIFSFWPVHIQRTVIISEAEVIMGNKVCKKGIKPPELCTRGDTILITLANEVTEWA